MGANLVFMLVFQVLSFPLPSLIHPSFQAINLANLWYILSFWWMEWFLFPFSCLFSSQTGLLSLDSAYFRSLPVVSILYELMIIKTPLYRSRRLFLDSAILHPLALTTFHDTKNSDQLVSDFSHSLLIGSLLHSSSLPITLDHRESTLDLQTSTSHATSLHYSYPSSLSITGQSALPWKRRKRRERRRWMERFFLWMRDLLLLMKKWMQRKRRRRISLKMER